MSDKFCKAFLKIYFHSYVFAVAKQSKYLQNHKASAEIVDITSGEEKNYTKQRNWPQTALV